MGCLWSSESSRERCNQCGRKAVNNLVIINQKCEKCTHTEARRLQVSTVSVDPTFRPSILRPTAPATGACFGVYKCTCGRNWESRLSRPNCYQICKGCRRRVHAKTQRPLKPSDFRDDKEKLVEHQEHLCQMCQQLGHYCGKSGNTTRKNRKSLSIKSWQKMRALSPRKNVKIKNNMETPPY